MTQDKFDLSRRKVLGSLGVVGTGAVLGGAGTAALFSDQDDVTGNSMQAGELDLLVSYDVTHNMDFEEQTSSGEGEGPGFTLSDVKPGDFGSAEITLEPDSNPAWIWMDAELSLNAENDFTEPEEDVDDTSANGKWDGELAQNVDATLKYESGEVISDGTLQSVINDVNGGTLIDYDPGTDGDDYFPENNDQTIVLDWSIDSSVGNVIQTDKTKFDLSFYAEQRRHNDSQSKSNPFSS